MGPQPLPRVLERAASKAAHFPAFDRSGGAFLDLDVFALRDLAPWRRCGASAVLGSDQRGTALVRVRVRVMVRVPPPYSAATSEVSSSWG